MSALGNKEIMARNIKRYMQKMGISRKDFCERLGFAYSTVTDWLNAEKYPRIDKIEMMANFFGISKADLVEPPASATAPPAPQKSDGLPELNARDERDIQKRLKSMLDDLDPNAWKTPSASPSRSPRRNIRRRNTERQTTPPPA